MTARGRVRLPMSTFNPTTREPTADEPTSWTTTRHRADIERREDNATSTSRSRCFQVASSWIDPQVRSRSPTSYMHLDPDPLPLVTTIFSTLLFFP